MTNKEQVDQDLEKYFAVEHKLRIDQKREHLRELFDRHFTFTQTDHSMTSSDLFHVVSGAKTGYANMRSSPYISGKAVEENDLRNVAVIEALLTYLNGNHLLKKIVKFEYTDPVSQYETLEDY